MEDVFFNKNFFVLSIITFDYHLEIRNWKLNMITSSNGKSISMNLNQAYYIIPYKSFLQKLPPTFVILLASTWHSKIALNIVLRRNVSLRQHIRIRRAMPNRGLPLNNWSTSQLSGFSKGRHKQYYGALNETVCQEILPQVIRCYQKTLRCLRLTLVAIDALLFVRDEIFFRDEIRNFPEGYFHQFLHSFYSEINAFLILENSSMKRQKQRAYRTLLF